MSIWQTLLAFDAAAEDRQPIADRPAHLLPDPAARSGWAELAQVAPHITTDGADDGGRVWPWLRVSASGPVVLDRAQVVALHEVLGAWLRESDPSLGVTGGGSGAGSVFGAR